jgi:NAD(P)-dependent dehydrogenase (short-subunit alcohol dehydrogenase family)
LRAVDLSDKVILLTGASGGIGAATARALGEAGASLVAHYFSNKEAALEATSGIPDDRRLLVGADFRQPGSARHLWAQALSWRGRVDVLVNNAAVMPETAVDATDSNWDGGWAEVLQVNVLEPASLTREAVRHYRSAGGGIVVTISSWAAEQGSAVPQLSAYAASKAAVKAMTQTIARAHAKDNVLAYVVAPGIVRTRMSQISVRSRGSEEAVKAILPLGEMVPPREVAELVAFAASGLCRHLSGATLDINGAAYIR